MSTINQSNFINSLNHRGGYIDLRTMSPELKSELWAPVISENQLRDITGVDQAIRGSRECDAIYHLLASDTPAASQDRVFRALQTEVDSNRARAAREGGLLFAGDATLELVLEGRATLR